jgi:hypothetical protein
MVMEVLLEVEVKNVDPARQNRLSIFSISGDVKNWAGRCNFNSQAEGGRHRIAVSKDVNGTYCA